MEASQNLYVPGMFQIISKAMPVKSPPPVFFSLTSHFICHQ